MPTVTLRAVTLCVSGIDCTDDLTVSYSVTPYQIGSRWQEEIPESVDVDSVMTGGCEVVDLLTEAEREMIVAKIKEVGRG
jgi:hypothetical protein